MAARPSMIKYTPLEEFDKNKLPLLTMRVIKHPTEFEIHVETERVETLYMVVLNNNYIQHTFKHWCKLVNIVPAQFHPVYDQTFTIHELRQLQHPTVHPDENVVMPFLEWATRIYNGRQAASRHFIDRYILEFDDTLLPEAPDVNREIIGRFRIKIASLNLKGSNQFFRERFNQRLDDLSSTESTLERLKNQIGKYIQGQQLLNKPENHQIIYNVINAHVDSLKDGVIFDPETFGQVMSSVVKNTEFELRLLMTKNIHFFKTKDGLKKQLHDIWTGVDASLHLDTTTRVLLVQFTQQILTDMTQFQLEVFNYTKLKTFMNEGRTQIKRAKEMANNRDDWCEEVQQKLQDGCAMYFRAYIDGQTCLNL